MEHAVLRLYASDVGYEEINTLQTWLCWSLNPTLTNMLLDCEPVVVIAGLLDSIGDCMDLLNWHRFTQSYVTAGGGTGV